MTWTQNYDPLGAWPLSTAVSALPVVTLFFVLLVLRKPVWLAALCGMAMAVLLAAGVFRMPAALIAEASLLGFVFGFLRITWIIIASIFLYHVAVETGQFQVMKESIAGLSSDRRIQVVLIAFCFGAFLEGTGGGGAPVAIAGAFLIGLGFPPFQAAVVCLLANTAPVAWGGVGNPVRALAGVTGLPEPSLNAMMGRILPPFSFILPIWLVRSIVPWKATWEVFPALLVAGAAFAGVQFCWSNYLESGLVDVVAAIFSLLALVAFLKIWKPRHLMTVDPAVGAGELRRHSVTGVLKGWSPFILTSVLIFLGGLPQVNKRLEMRGQSYRLSLPSWLGLPEIDKSIRMPSLNFPLAGLHNAVTRVPPVVPEPTPEKAEMDLNVLSLPGTHVLAGGILSALLLGMPVAGICRIFGRTLWQLMLPLLAISFMVGLAFVTKYSGMDTVLGLSLTRTGWLYPLFGTLLGWLGVALTGTDAGSNALFGNLQKVTAEQLGLSPVLMASANSTGGVMGKMIAAQSIVVASTATGQEGREAAIFKAVIGHSIALAVLVGLLVLAYAYLVPGVVPSG